MMINLTNELLWLAIILFSFYNINTMMSHQHTMIELGVWCDIVSGSIWIIVFECWNCIVILMVLVLHTLVGNPRPTNVIIIDSLNV